MDTASRLLPLLALLLALLLGTWGSPACAEPIDADHNRTKNMISAYEQAPNWVVKAMALLGLGQRWHPEGNRIVLDALRSRDRRLQAFGLEAYRGVAVADLPVLLSSEVLDELIRRHGREKNRFFRGYLNILLSRAFPAAADSGKRWSPWWATVKDGYKPPSWQEQPLPKGPAGVGHGTVARKSVVTRAMELSQDGIELVFVFDSTGSMQATIDAARAAMTPVLGILEGLSPDLKIGLVHYKDRGDLGGGSDPDAGAEVRVRLLSNLRKVRKSMGQMSASGGGDIPERVYGGLWLALQREMGWTLSACKMVVLIGDAPPHPEDIEPALGLVRKARLAPAAQLASRRKKAASVPTGHRVRPIFTSAIWTGPAAVKSDSDEDAPGGAFLGPGLLDLADGVEVFENIAQAGGGVFAILKRGSSASETSASIVSHLVSLTFGLQHEQAARRLAERYVFWRKQGLFK